MLGDLLAAAEADEEEKAVGALIADGLVIAGLVDAEVARERTG
jgi:hypothetical protein